MKQYLEDFHKMNWYYECKRYYLVAVVGIQKVRLPIIFRKVLAVCDSVKWEIISNAGSTARLSFKLKTN